MSAATIDTSATAPATPASAPANTTSTAAPQAAAAPNGGVGSPAGVAAAPSAAPAVAPEKATAATATKFLLSEDQPPAVVTDSAPAAIDAKATDAKATTAPAADWKLEAPKDAQVDAQTLTAVESFAKEAGLTKAQAEKILGRDLTAREAAKAAESQRSAQIANDWASEAEKHPEIGGVKLPQAISNAKRALQAFATADERKAIANSPFANNPMFIAILNRAAAAIPQEDTVHAATTQAPMPQVSTPEFRAKTLYAGI